MQNLALINQVKPIVAYNSAVPNGTAQPRYVSLKNANRITILILASNATTVTGSAITLKQATNVSGAGEKSLNTNFVFTSLDTTATDNLTLTAVTSGTFTTDATNSKNLMYWIELQAPSLDVNNGYDCVRVNLAAATASTVTVIYLLQDAYAPSLTQSSIID